MVVRDSVKFLTAFLTAILIFLLILGVAGFLAIRNFDPNRFRAEFEKYLTQQTGFRVELGDIKLGWRPQPQLQVGSLKFYHPVSHEKILQSDQLRMDMDLTSILRKRFSMSQIVIQSPVIFLKRDRGGVWNWQAVKGPMTPLPSAAPMLSQVSFIPTAEASEGAGNSSAKDLSGITQGWEFGIGKILVRDATVHFVDETADPAFKLEFEKLNAEVRQKAPAEPFHFTAEGAVLGSAKKNLDADGDLDLAAQSLDFELRYGLEKAKLKGHLKLIRAMPHFEGTLAVRDLDMESVIPEVYKHGNYVAGRLSADANLSFEGANPEQITRSLAGQGTLEIKEGALKNRNLIKEVFDRLSSVVAVTSALGGELPPQINEMLKDSDTPFQSLNVAYAVQSGIFRVSELRLIHPNYQLSGQGSYGILEKRVEGAMQLVLSKAVSDYLSKKIRELAYLADRTGQVTIPFRCSGVLPDVAIQPDFSSITSQLLQVGTEQLLSRGMGKLSKKLGSKKTGKVSVMDLLAPQSSGDEQSSTAAAGSGSDQLIQQGLALFSKYREAKQQ